MIFLLVILLIVVVATAPREHRFTVAVYGSLFVLILGWAGESW